MTNGNAVQEPNVFFWILKHKIQNSFGLLSKDIQDKLEQRPNWSWMLTEEETNAIEDLFECDESIGEGSWATAGDHALIKDVNNMIIPQRICIGGMEFKVSIEPLPDNLSVFIRTIHSIHYIVLNEFLREIRKKYFFMHAVTYAVLQTACIESPERYKGLLQDEGLIDDIASCLLEFHFDLKHLDSIFAKCKEHVCKEFIDKVKRLFAGTLFSETES